MSSYAPGEKAKQQQMIALLDQVEALAPEAGVVHFEWRVKTVTGYEAKSVWSPDRRAASSSPGKNSSNG